MILYYNIFNGQFLKICKFNSDVSKCHIIYELFKGLMLHTMPHFSDEIVTWIWIIPFLFRMYTLVPSIWSQKELEGYR